MTPLERPRRSLLTEPPPELDGSKRRRMVRFLVAGLVIFAAGITWSVVRSQIDFSSGFGLTPATTRATAVALPPPPPPPPPPSTTATTTVTAVDPGQVTHPGKPAPSATAPGGRKGPSRGRIPRQPNDGTIVVPEPDEDSVPSAP